MWTYGNQNATELEGAQKYQTVVPQSILNTDKYIAETVYAGM